MISVLLATLLWIQLASTEHCLKQEDIRSDFVKQSFNVTKFLGLYYETLYHDYTQPKFCKCQRSNKELIPKLNMIYDNFTIVCVGKEYSNPLMFNLTDEKGVFRAWVNDSVLKRIPIEDTVVDVGVNRTTGEYDWIIEFQCVEHFDKVLFIGINFYTRDRFATNETQNAMLEAAKKNGIGEYVQKENLIVNDQKNCAYQDVESIFV